MTAGLDPSRPRIAVGIPKDSAYIHAHDAREDQPAAAGLA